MKHLRPLVVGVVAVGLAACATGTLLDSNDDGLGGAGSTSTATANPTVTSTSGTDVTTATGLTTTGTGLSTTGTGQTTTTSGNEPFCGDGTCNNGETCDTCPDDCTTGCTTSGCGDSICDVNGGECDTCPDDCTGNPSCTTSSGTCDHSDFTTGDALNDQCDECTLWVCDIDGLSSCCTSTWDDSCVADAEELYNDGICDGS